MRRYRAGKKAAAAPPAFPVPDPPADPAAALAAWSAEKLKVPTGPLRGKPFILAPWQIDFFVTHSHREYLRPGAVCRENPGRAAGFQFWLPGT